MAKLSDLPAELVSRIVHYVFYYIMPLQTSTDTPVDATHSVTTTRWTTPKSSTTRPNGKYDLTKKDSEVMVSRISSSLSTSIHTQFTKNMK
jgi:hypothetical protein